MQKGLIKLMDLGAYWERETGYPIPLGGIVVKKEIDIAVQKQIWVLIRQSVEYAFSNYPDIPPFVKKHSQEMEEQVMKQHIELYVNNYSVSLGDKGKEAVEKFVGIYKKMNSTPSSDVISLIG
jgi:1,4-dihydroxy-6-naphthoate synthase